jgi:acyl carrier protein
MDNRQAIYEKVVSILSELFEVEASGISEDSLLYEDLDIDSIDAVDLIVELKSFTGKKMSPDNFKTVRSVGDVVTAVSDLVD